MGETIRKQAMWPTVALGAITIIILTNKQAECGEKVERTLDEPAVQIWRIDEPNVRQRDTQYKQVTFKPGDKVRIRSGGGVQTGGRGKTWKRYVDPSGKNSDHLYHGLIQLPGMGGLTRIQDFLRNHKDGFILPEKPGGDLTLHLGYEDDDYSDNGYWGHDDGTEDQCKDVGPAWVEIIIVRKSP